MKEWIAAPCLTARNDLMRAGERSLTARNDLMMFVTMAMTAVADE